MVSNYQQNWGGERDYTMTLNFPGSFFEVVKT